MRFIYSVLSKIFGFNFSSTPKEVIIDQMKEPRALPIGKNEFEEWSDRIIAGAMLPVQHLWDEVEVERIKLGVTSGSAMQALFDMKLKIFHESQKFALADLLTHLGPTESHKPDAFFIHSLRKFAVNQVAVSIRKELHDKAKARTAAEEGEAIDEISGGQVS